MGDLLEVGGIGVADVHAGEAFHHLRDGQDAVRGAGVEFVQWRLGVDEQGRDVAVIAGQGDAVGHGDAP